MSRRSRLPNPSTDSPCALCLGRPYTRTTPLCPACRENIEAETAAWNGGTDEAAAADGGGMRCWRCGGELRPRDAEAADNAPLSESDRLVHRDERVCEAYEAQMSRDIIEAMFELQDDGLFEVRVGPGGDGGRQDA